LIIGTHADDEGIILVAVDSTIPAPITYEKLQNATSAKLPTELNKPGTSFRIFGCIIGSDNSLPLLKLLKQTLGNPQAVVAPKYLYGVGSLGEASWKPCCTNSAFSAQRLWRPEMP